LGEVRIAPHAGACEGGAVGSQQTTPQSTRPAEPPPPVGRVDGM